MPTVLDFGDRLVAVQPRGRSLSVSCLFSNAEKFWALVDRSGGPSACWPFLGRRNQRGYGGLYLDGVGWSTHRLAYTLTFGPIPPGEGHHGTCVCHHCDFPPCCNPNHLWLGTNFDNARDKVRKGRARNQFSGYLTDDLRSAIADAFVSDDTGRTFTEKCDALAPRFNVSDWTVRQILIDAGVHEPGRSLRELRQQIVEAHRADPTTPKRALAARFGIGSSTVRRILRQAQTDTAPSTTQEAIPA